MTQQIPSEEVLTCHDGNNTKLCRIKQITSVFSGDRKCEHKQLSTQNADELSALEDKNGLKYLHKTESAWYYNIALICLVEFGSEASRGLVLPALYSYGDLLGGGLVFLGLLTSLFSAGRFISSLFLGWLSDRWSFLHVYYLSCSISLIGNLAFVLAYAAPWRSQILLGCSRFIIGFGAGSRSVCRSNIAALTRTDQRLVYFNLLAVVVFHSYALTPGIAGFFGDVNVVIIKDFIEMNRFTASGFLLIGFHIMTIVLLRFVYNDTITREHAPITNLECGPDSSESPQVEIATAGPEEGSESQDVHDATGTEINQERSTLEPATLDIVEPMSERLVMVGVFVFLAQNFVARGILSIFETVNVPMYMMATSVPIASDEIIRETSDFFLGIGFLGLITYAALYLLQRVPDKLLLLFAHAALIAGNAIMAAITPATHTEDTRIDISWFIVAEVLIWSIGCPLATAVVTSAFSKTLGTRPQGIMMGVYGSAGSVARMIMPMLPGLLNGKWSLLFLIQIILCVCSVVALLLYMRLLPRPRSRRASIV